MKSLDKVIEKIESAWVCPSSDEAAEFCELIEIREDALQYLRWYKELADDSEAFAKWKQNPPLTWDELKSMEGKPVWVESSDSFNRRRWMFVGEWFDDDEMRLFDMGDDYPDYVSKKGYESGTWQAYRKER